MSHHAFEEGWISERNELRTHSGRISDVRKSPTDKAGRGPVAEGCVGSREAAVLVRKDSGTALRLGSDLLLLGVMIVRRETGKKTID